MTTIYDETSNNLDGTTVGTPTFGTGIIGDAITMDGIGDYITLVDTALLRPTTFSVCCWIRHSNISGVDTIFSCYSQESSIVSGFDFKIRDAGVLQVTVGKNTGIVNTVDYLSALGTTLCSTGVWTHVTATYDGTDMKLYVNGQLDVVTNFPSGLAYASPTYCRVGAKKSLAANPEVNFFDGEMDDLRLYPRALTAVEVDLVYNVASISNPTDYIGFWDMDTDNITGATVSDQSSNGLDATMVGTPTTGVSGATYNTGQAVELNGTSQYLTIADNTLVQDVTNFSSSLWFRTTTTLSSNLHTVWANYGSARHGIRITLGASYDFAVLVELSDGIGSVFETNYFAPIGGIPFLNDGEWHHVCVSWDGKTCRSYIDGQPDIVDDISPGFPDLSGGNHVIGARIFGDNFTSTISGYFDGRIDNVKFFDRAISGGEVAAMYLSDTSVGILDTFIARWTMDDVVSTTLGEDSTIHDGTITGATQVTGIEGTDALSFDGIDDYVIVPYSVDLEPTAVTMSAWINTDSEDLMEIMGKQRETTPGWSGYRMSMRYGFVSAFIGANTLSQADGSGVDYTVAERNFYDGYISDGTWHHVVGTYANNRLKYYMDGVLLQDIHCPTMGYSTFSDPLMIGARSNNLGTTRLHNYEGLIDAVVVYGTELTQEQVTTLYEADAVAVPTDQEGHWTLDTADISGSSVTDSTGNTHTGTIVGTPSTVTAGAVGQCLDFDGIGDYITISNDVGLQSTTMTASAWIRPRDILASTSVIIANMNNDGLFAGFTFYLGVDGLLYFLIGKNTGNTNNVDRLYTISPECIKLDSWTFVTATYDNSVGAKVYVNGLLVGENNEGSGFLVFDATTRPAIGGRTADGGSTYGLFFDGYIDDVRYFDYALTPTQIRELYKDTQVVHGLLNDYIAYYSFNDYTISGSALSDMTQTHDVTMVNTPTPTASGVAGDYLLFDRTLSERVTMPNTSEFKTASFSFHCWIKLDKADIAVSRGVVSNYSANTERAGYYIYVQGGQENRLVAGFGKDTGTVNNTDFVNLLGEYHSAIGKDEEWHSILITSKDGVCALYQDGVLLNVRNIGSAVVWDAVNYHQLGALNSTGTFSSYFSGGMDEVMYFDRELTAREADYLYAEYEEVVDMPTDEVAYWPLTFETTNGSSVTDVTGGFTGTIVNGATNVSAVINSGVTLDGIDQYITVADHATLKPSTAFTISLWYNVQGTNTEGQHDLFVSYNNSPNVGGIRLSVYDSGLMFALVGANTGSTADVDYKSFSVLADDSAQVTGRWRMGTLTYDGTTIKIYEGCNVVAETAWAGGIGYNATNYVQIGARNNNGVVSRYANCITSHVRLFDRALSKAEIRALLNHRPTPTDYIARWVMDEVSGTTFADSSGNGHTATVVNSPVMGLLGYKQPQKSVKFDGTDQYATVVDSADFKTTDVTVSLWFKTSTTTSAVLFSTCTNDTNSYINGYLFSFNSGTSVFRFIVCSGTGTTINVDYDFAETRSGLNDGKWHHLVGRFVSSTNTITIYTDGVYDDSVVLSNGLDFAADTRIRIGSRNYPYPTPVEGEYFEGSIRDIQVYDRIVSSTDIERIYAEGVLND